MKESACFLHAIKLEIVKVICSEVIMYVSGFLLNLNPSFLCVMWWIFPLRVIFTL